jgi:hypothetical protein
MKKGKEKRLTSSFFEKQPGTAFISKTSPFKVGREDFSSPNKKKSFFNEKVRIIIFPRILIPAS